MSAVIDASAVLAILGDERGGDIAAASARGAVLSTVNFSEVLAKMSDRGIDAAELRRLIDRLEIGIEPFSARQAEIAAALRPSTRDKNVSLADRCCLAVAIDMEAPLLTADRDWVRLDLGHSLDFILIR